MIGSRHSSIPALAACALLAATALFTAGCKHVEPVEGANAVRVTSNEQAGHQGCTRRGETMVEVPAKIWFVARSKETVAAELETMARNAALELDGNAVAPDSEVSEGKRSYTIYRCN